MKVPKAEIETLPLPRLRTLLSLFRKQVVASDEYLDGLPWVPEARLLKTKSSRYDESTWPQSGDEDIADVVLPSQHLFRVPMTEQEESFLIDNELVSLAQDAKLISQYEGLLQAQERRLSELALRARELQAALSARDVLIQKAHDEFIFRRNEAEEIRRRDHNDKRLNHSRYDFSRAPESNLTWFEQRRLKRLRKLAAECKANLTAGCTKLRREIDPFRSLRLLGDHTFARLSNRGRSVLTVLDHVDFRANCSTADVLFVVQKVDVLRNGIPPLEAAVIYLRYGQSAAARLFAKTQSLAIPANTRPEIFLKCAKLEAIEARYTLRVNSEFSPCGCEGGQTSKDYCYFTCSSCNGSGGSYYDVLTIVEEQRPSALLRN